MGCHGPSQCMHSLSYSCLLSPLFIPLSLYSPTPLWSIWVDLWWWMCLLILISHFWCSSFHPPGAPSSLRSKLNVTLKIYRSVLGNHHARVPLSSACTQMHAARGKKYGQLWDAGAAACVDIMEMWGYGSNDGSATKERHRLFRKGKMGR